MKLTFVIFCLILLIFGCTSCKVENPIFQAELIEKEIKPGTFKLISSQTIEWADILEIQHKNGSSYIIVKRGGGGLSVIKL